MTCIADAAAQENLKVAHAVGLRENRAPVAALLAHGSSRFIVAFWMPDQRVWSVCVCVCLKAGAAADLKAWNCCFQRLLGLWHAGVIFWPCLSNNEPL